MRCQRLVLKSQVRATGEHAGAGVGCGLKLGEDSQVWVEQGGAPDVVRAMWGLSNMIRARWALPDLVKGG